MITSFGLVIILSSLLCFLSKSYLKNDGDNSFVIGLLQIQGWLGLSICLWGIWEIIYAQLDLSKLATDLFYWINVFAGGLINIFMGALLGFSMIQRLTIAEVPVEKRDSAIKTRFQLVMMQINASYLAGIFGFWLMFYSFALK